MDFYNSKCNEAESIVKLVIVVYPQSALPSAACTLQVFFQDCCVYEVTNRHRIRLWTQDNISMLELGTDKFRRRECGKVANNWCSWRLHRYQHPTSATRLRRQGQCRRSFRGSRSQSCLVRTPCHCQLGFHKPSISHNPLLHPTSCSRSWEMYSSTVDNVR